MQRLQAFKYELMPDGAQQRNLRRYAGSCRFVYNKALAFLDQGWGEFRRQLDYKTVWNGGMLFAVPAHYSSQECPECHHVSADNRQTQARFVCVKCHYENHADHVGAINVLERGHRLLACGDGALRSSMKQELTEVSQLSG